ncbi:MAG: MerR family transcriptional regulator [Dehalococcoidia bacterium]|nr:MerR family transcriptional regulator [Dehalococcoidia bacterium]
MKISELSERTGITIPTLKFYLREGLLRPGALTAPNQADYGEAHVRRARLVRTLREVAHLGIAQISAITGALDRGEDLYDVMGVTVDSLGERPAGAFTPEQQAAAAAVDRLLATLGLPVREGSLAREQLIVSFAAVREMLFPGLPVEAMVPYARAAEDVVRAEVAATPGIFSVDPEQVLERAVLGLTLFEPILLAFRRLAHEKLVGDRLDPPAAPEAGPD